MTTTREDNGLADAGRTRSGSARRRAKGSTGVVVYSECSVTVCVDRKNNNYVKVTVGHERLSPSDSEHDLAATEKAAWAFNEKVVDRRVSRIKRLIASIEAQS